MTDRQQSLLQAAAVIYSHGNCTADSAVAVALDLEALIGRELAEGRQRWAADMETMRKAGAV